MLKKLFLFWLFLLSLFALSCNNNALKPDVYSKEMLVIKGLAKERTDYKVFKNMLANNSQEEEPGKR